MGAESNLWKCTRPHLIEIGCFVQRLETSTAEGVPDVWVGYVNEYAWLENKAVPNAPARPETRVFGSHGLSVEQENWLLNAAQRRVRAWIWAGVGRGARRQTYLVPAHLAGEFNSMPLNRLQPYAVPLAGLAAALFGRG